MRLREKVSVVTGGGSGIGRATCQRFGKEGSSVIVAEINEETGQETVDLINRDGGSAALFLLDVTDINSVNKMVSETCERFKTIDVLVNNAVAFVMGTVEDASEEDWIRVFKTNVIGYANCIKAVTPVFRKAGGGSIINIASVSAFIAQPKFVPYNASKGAVSQLTRCTALDLASDNIRVNAICPGSVSGDRMKRVIEAKAKSLGVTVEKVQKDYESYVSLGKFVDKEDIANMAVFLLSEEAHKITGQVMTIDGHTERMN